MSARIAQDLDGRLPELMARAHVPGVSAVFEEFQLAAAEGLGTVAVHRGWRPYVDPATLVGWGSALADGALVPEIGHLVRASTTATSPRFRMHSTGGLARLSDG